MEKEEILGILEKDKAVITGSHVVYTSGKHGEAYVNKDAVYPHTGHIIDLCQAIAEHFMDSEIEAVIGPAIGGVILSQRVAELLTELTGREVLSVYAEPIDKDTFVIKRGYDKLVDAKRILVVEDVLTTGGSVKKVIDATRVAGGIIIGVGALCNRGGLTAAALGVPDFFALLDIPLAAYEEADYPLCAQGVPINTEVGKGREFLARKEQA